MDYVIATKKGTVCVCATEREARRRATRHSIKHPGEIVYMNKLVASFLTPKAEPVVTERGPMTATEVLASRAKTPPPAWNKDIRYLPGDEVTFAGRVYKATDYFLKHPLDPERGDPGLCNTCWKPLI